MGVSIGIDIGDHTLTAYCHESKALFSVPAVVARDKREDIWCIGEDAYRAALSGSGVIADRLIALLKRQGTVTIMRRSYSAHTLIARLLGEAVTRLLNSEDISTIDHMAIAIRKADTALFEGIRDAALLLGISPDRISLLSYEEAFIHYTLAQASEFSFNDVGLFDLSQDEFGFYRMRVVRGTGRKSAVAESRDIEEKFRLGILDRGQGSELGDRILLEAAQKYMGNDVYSAVFLTGSGFERTDWAREFIAFICMRRRVIYEAGLFAIGAAVYASYRNTETSPDYLSFCDTRLSSAISIGVSVRDRDSRLIMLSQGESWFMADTYAELIPAGQNYIDIDIEPAELRRPKKTRRIQLNGFPKRPDKCTRVSVRISPVDGTRILVRVTDLGFGDFYEASGAKVDEYIML